MHLIYVDESGDDGFNVNNIYSTPTPTPYYIKVALILHDRKWHSIESAIRTFRLGWNIPPNNELHATRILSGRDKKHTNWYGNIFPDKAIRMQLLMDACKVLATLNLTMICVVIDKSKILQTSPNYKDMPKNKSWEFLIERTNLFLGNAGDKKGMIISDAIEYSIEKEHRTFAKALYAQSSHINNWHFIESILFEPSDSSQMLQLVDIAAFACHRKYNRNDDSYFKIIEHLLYARHSSPNGVGLKIWPL